MFLTSIFQANRVRREAERKAEWAAKSPKTRLILLMHYKKPYPNLNSLYRMGLTHPALWVVWGIVVLLMSAALPWRLSVSGVLIFFLLFTWLVVWEVDIATWLGRRMMPKAKYEYDEWAQKVCDAVEEWLAQLEGERKPGVIHLLSQNWDDLLRALQHHAKKVAGDDRVAARAMVSRNVDIQLRVYAHLSNVRAAQAKIDQGESDLDELAKV